MSQRISKRKKSTDLSWVKWHSSRGVSWVHDQGYRWVKEQYFPGLKRLEKAVQAREVKEVLSLGYYVLGDVHDFNWAPMQAVRAYKKSIQHFPEPDYASGSWREMGNMYGQVGKWDEAIKCLKKAVNISPEDKVACDDLEIIQYDKKKNRTLYDIEDRLYQAFELLAQDKPYSALETLAGKRGLEAALARACAYGQLDDYESFISEWRKIAGMKSSIYLRHKEWFYMPDQCWEKPELWEIFFEIESDGRFDQSVFLSYSSLREQLPPPKFLGDLADQRSDEQYMAWKHEYYTAMIRYMIAVTKDDAGKLKALAKKYPSWTEPQKAITSLPGAAR